MIDNFVFYDTGIDNTSIIKYKVNSTNPITKLLQKSTLT